MIPLIPLSDLFCFRSSNFKIHPGYSDSFRTDLKGLNNGDVCNWKEFPCVKRTWMQWYTDCCTAVCCQFSHGQKQYSVLKVFHQIVSGWQLNLKIKTTAATFFLLRTSFWHVTQCCVFCMTCKPCLTGGYPGAASCIYYGIYIAGYAIVLEN